MPEYQDPDPRARRLATVIVVGALVVATFGIVLIGGSDRFLFAWLESNIELLIERPHYPALAGLVAVLPIFGMNVYLWRFCQSIVRHRRFPPPGSTVSRRTKIVTGRPALRRGRLLQALIAAMTLTALAVPLVLWSTFSRLAETAH